MEYLIAVFTSRSQTLLYSNLLKGIGVPNAVISTPQEVAKACGISVKFSRAYLNDAKVALQNRRLCAFKGFYLVSLRSGRMIITPV